MKCFERNGNEKVPGYNGEGTAYDDYCIHPDLFSYGANPDAH